MDFSQLLMEAPLRIIPLGRMTLDPMAHIDPMGSLLLPALGVPFGWAKPVPVNPARFRRGVNMDTGMMLTAIAGPLSNAGHHQRGDL